MRISFSRRRPIEFLFEFVVNLLLEILWQLCGDILVALGRHLITTAPREPGTNPLLAALVLFALGCIGGGTVSAFFREPFFNSHPMPGASLILSPLVNGALMEFYGRWRERHGKDRTSLSTYWGGGVFALGMALVRFWWVTA